MARSRAALAGALLLLGAPGGEPMPVGDGGPVWTDSPPAPAKAEAAPAIEPPGALVALADLEPVFASGPLAEAKRAFDGADYRTTVALFDAQVSRGALPPEARFLRALALLRSGADQEAGRELLALADLLPAVRDHCLFSAATAFEDQKQFEDAAALYRRVDGGSPLHRDALLAESRALAAIGTAASLAAASEVLGPLAALAAPPGGLGRDIGSEALFALAQLAEKQGKLKQAGRHYRNLWLEHPLSPVADAAGIEAGKLGVGLGSTAQLVGRAELILAGNHNLQAIQALEPLVKQLRLAGAASAVLPCQAHFALAKALKKQRRHTEALAEFRRVIAGCTGAATGELRARALYLGGQSAAVIDPPSAKVLFTQLVQQFPKSSFADDALFFAADVEAKNLADVPAAAADLQALIDRYPDGDYAQEARFRLFWLSRKDGKALETRGELHRIAGAALAGTARDPEPVRRARYWLARTDDDQDRLQALAAAWPADYYGDLAAAALLRPPKPPVPPGPSPVALHAGSLESDDNFRAGTTLLRIGLPAAADEEFESIDRKTLTAPGGKLEPLLLLAVAMTRAGNPRTGHAIVKSLLEQPGYFEEGSPDAAGTTREARGLLRLLFEVAYPRAFRPEVERWAAPASVPPNLLQGLMREESALDPAVLSAAGAIGLCQLMPATGQRLAHRLGLGEVTPERLREPELNIRLGAAYLGELLKRYGGRQVLAVAAYNAGEAAVDRWLSQAGGEAMDAFVEDIPIAETRNYVKRVMTSAAVYRSLEGG